MSTLRNSFRRKKRRSAQELEICPGLNGFEELRKYIKQGSEFCKEVSAIIQERADLEGNYAKHLNKLSQKLVKATTGNLGTLAEGWRSVASVMEQEAELHRNLGQALAEEISKPLKSLVEAQNKARKPIEATVDKSLKTLTDRRTEETKAKKQCYVHAKDSEKGEELRTDTSKGKTEKDKHKIEKKCDQMRKQLRKADKDYCELCEKAETARQEWEFNVAKGSAQLQTLDEERLAKMADYLNQYNSHLSVMGPRLQTSCDKLHESVISVDIQEDLKAVAKQRGTQGTPPEQILLDCYAEDLQFTMNAERRKNYLQNYLLYLRQSLEREKKGKEGVEKLVGVYKERPNFADQDAQEDARQRLCQVMFMMNFLEASHYKIASVLAKLECQPKLEHKFAKYIETVRDKQGIPTSVLRLPINIALEGNSGYDVTSVTVGALANQTQSDPYEEPFADDEFEDFTDHSHVIGRCRALYDYDANRNDELTIKHGDVINLYDKQLDDWWQGELQGRVGIFPATYVEEI
ncbi:nostrin-like isoform X3 [Saccostrea echinata]|uniref:nostrin-like isoform X3 n=1 Tax=Saccostrea echinata TaxID=191078 RepID=UPI002A7FDCC1|nr:nostrin-like isoform X3 [Saccostrea echinata]